MQEPKTGHTGPQVKIHLNLRHAERAESSIKAIFMENGRRKAVTVGYARHIVMRDVVPEVEADKCHRIGHVDGAMKTPCAYLSGELLAWAGRLRDDIPGDRDDLRDAVAALRIGDAAFKVEVGAALKAGTPIGFNPKKANVFYRQPEAGQGLRESFRRAGRLVACHWQFMALDAEFAPIRADETLTQAAPPSGFEQNAIPQGIATTRKRLEEWRAILR